MKNFYLFITVILIFASCGTTKSPYYATSTNNWKADEPNSGKEIIHSLYLVGDTGELDDPNDKTNIVVETVKANISKESTETSLVFLGDNIYPVGMPNKKDPVKRKIAEDIINAQLSAATSHDGKTYFIPGNHDWNKHKKGGRKAIKRQEDYIESYFGKKDKKVHFYPNDACADPKVVKINKDLVYVFLDTQWWLQNWSHEKKMNRGCHIKSRQDLLKTIQEIFTEHKNDEIIVMMHHPIKSDGTHGGNFNLKHHLFPLTELNSSLWIPLPLIGSAYPGYRKITGSKQDITNKYNQEMMQGINAIATKLRINVVFASGHDHGLQYFEQGKLKYIVSGAGGKIDHVKKGGDALYARSARGYVKINFYEDFESWAEYYTVDDNEVATLEYRVQLREPRPGTVEEEIHYPPVGKETMTIAANEKLAAGGFKKMFMGSQYRDMWATPVEAEVIDLETKLGGLTPIKKGGGMASNSLRMQIDDGKNYILRSIKKDYTKLVPAGFENLKVVNVMADQNSASHPYNALIIPKLSEAAGIFYTSPKLVYLKHQRGLGNYNSQFPEELYLLEERPSGDWSNAAQFGNSDEIIGYVDLLEILRTKKNHFVDQEWVLKSRMFDLFIHDWDRHDDQWRWAKFEEGDHHIYRPIPRDRDQAFYRFKGVIPWYIATFVQKQFKTIKEDCKDVTHLAFNAKHFDRYFTNDLEWSEWQKIIAQMQKDITDEDIDKAIQMFPKEIMHLDNDEELGRILKARKRNLMKMGERLYKFLSKEVEIVGTDNKDKFVMTRHSNGNVTVKQTLDSKDHGELVKYERTFYPNETKEIRVYGLRGKDEFEINGTNNGQINIRVIGGEDKDNLKNITTRSVAVYDDIDGIKYSGKVSDKTSDEIDVNEYDRNGFTYNSSFPLVTFGNTVDDGWWIGGSLSWVKQGWRKSPYKSKQGLSISFAPGSRNAFQVGYHGHFPDAISKLDFVPQADLQYPYYENYFGLGNTTSYDPDIATEFNWVRMENIDINPRLRANLGNASTLEFGPLFAYRNPKRTEGRVSDDEMIGFSDSDMEARNYLGADIHYKVGFVDNTVFPSNGFHLHANASYMADGSKDEKVTQISGIAQFYLRLINSPRTVIATQVGYQKSFGDLQFYQYADLGNNNGLRGYRNERFRGESAFFHNIDIRMKLFEWNNNILPMDVGILGGYDYGKVYIDGQDSDRWHDSRTIGLWFELLGAMVVQPYYSLNDELNVFALKVGFNF